MSCTGQPNSRGQQNGSGRPVLPLPRVPARLDANQKGAPDYLEKVSGVLDQIQEQCDLLLQKLQAVSVEGSGEEPGVPRSLNSEPRPEWSKAGMRFAQALGVVKKCNRDLASPHWKKSGCLP